LVFGEYNCDASAQFLRYALYLFKDWSFLRKIQKVLLIEKLIVPLESAPQELSNEWSCQYVSTLFGIWWRKSPSVFEELYLYQNIESCHNLSMWDENLKY
jgi:hypothetical protein